MSKNQKKKKLFSLIQCRFFFYTQKSLNSSPLNKIMEHSNAALWAYSKFWILGSVTSFIVKINKICLHFQKLQTLIRGSPLIWVWTVWIKGLSTAGNRVERLKDTWFFFLIVFLSESAYLFADAKQAYKIICPYNSKQ